ncbi:MAG: hypothetical protein DI565_19585 [Ancylobacter novellus]|uniref:Uncharacterized protein n=1 Tax=Ancylobacter novellus TaxID=921 RepID=A0A2W5K098_ANCNO|nr:MAG: hypothetical protein DI565_19585 [Ancylobacter novellus]
MFAEVDHVVDVPNDACDAADEIVLIFRHPSVNDDWLRHTLTQTAPTAFVEISAEFLFDFVEGAAQLAAIRRAARRHEAADLTMDHAWYGADRARIERFDQGLVKSLETYLFRHARRGRPGVAVISARSFEDPRMSELIAWTKGVWPAARIVLATSGEAASAEPPTESDALGALLVIADGHAEAWFTGAMRDPGDARDFLSSWFSERST